jgi:hypothetical protein
MLEFQSFIEAAMKFAILIRTTLNNVALKFMRLAQNLLQCHLKQLSYSELFFENIIWL